MIRGISIGCALIATLAATPALTYAQEPKVNVIRLEPKKMEGVEQGKAVVVKGAAGPQAHRFLIDQVTYMMPIAVAVRPVNKGDDVGLTITKYAWNQPLREGRTDGDILRYAFRTESEFQVSVDAKKAGTPYRLMVWVGDETKPKLTPVVVKASEFQGEKSGGLPGNLVLWVIAGALVAIVALLAVIVLRRKAS